MPGLQVQKASLPWFLRRIDECSRDASLGPVVLVALGDSVTAGAGPGDIIYVDEVYHARLRVMLEERYPGCPFKVINSAIGGETAEGAVERFDEAVLAHQPDLLLIAYGLNDAATGGREGLEKYRGLLESFIVRARAGCKADIILLTPNMMPTYETELVPDRWQHILQPFISLQKEGVLAAYAQSAVELGAEQGVAVADVYTAWTELAAQGVDTTRMLVNGLNHPDEEGHRLAARVIMNVIDERGGQA